ncbi:hypothetical protein [Marivirga sp.]|uniref:hypothetical protein n=1 Tax=Marivirga sp. TaxID=2018662 RepID=UPI0025E76951|nr:hypothetical protein [Marivirga sp.]
MENFEEIGFKDLSQFEKSNIEGGLIFTIAASLVSTTLAWGTVAAAGAAIYASAEAGYNQACGN